MNVASTILPRLLRSGTIAVLIDQLEIRDRSFRFAAADLVRRRGGGARGRSRLEAEQSRRKLKRQ